MDSPCNKTCTLEQGTCIGCGRTIQQIVDWAKYTDEQRKKIMESLRRRLSKSN